MVLEVYDPVSINCDVSIPLVRHFLSVSKLKKFANCFEDKRHEPSEDTSGPTDMNIFECMRRIRRIGIRLGSHSLKFADSRLNAL